MDVLLSKVRSEFEDPALSGVTTLGVTQQAMNYAIRSGITITSGYAIRQCSNLLKASKSDDKDELATLQRRLESKIRIISPAIDMIELIAARGNTSLESAVSLTKALRWDIQTLGVRLAKAVNDEELLRKGSSKAKTRAQNDYELKLIIKNIRDLLERIEDAVPLINLAITTSGVNLSTNLPSTVSPSRLLQASTFLTAGDSQYCMAPGRLVQIGPIFTLSMYMLFSGHAHRPRDEEGIRESTWKEVMHKAHVKLLRTPLADVYQSSPHAPPVNGTASTELDDEHFPPQIPSEGRIYEFAYQLLVIEDLNDDRVHTFEEDEDQPGPYDDVALAGIRETIPIHQVSKIFYADTGKILNIGSDPETNSPILLLKRDVNAVPPRRMMAENTNEPEWYDEPSLAQEDTLHADPDHRENQLSWEKQTSREPSPDPEIASGSKPESNAWRLPQDLDPEWIAFEVYTEDPDSDEEDEVPLEDSSNPQPLRPSRPSWGSSLDATLTSAFSRLHLHHSPAPSSTTLAASPSPNPHNQLLHSPVLPSPFPALRSSLSLLELLIRLTALQQFQQSSHLAITDELLNFFLSESSTTGAGGDSDLRRRARRDARRRVGFDPYDESPIKRRGEEYLDQHGQHGTHVWDGDREDYTSPVTIANGTPAGKSEASSYAYQYGSNWQGDNNKASAYRARLQSPISEAPSPSPLLRRSTREQAAARLSTPDPHCVFAPQPEALLETTESRSSGRRRESGTSKLRRSPLGRDDNAEIYSTPDASAEPQSESQSLS